MFQPGLLKCEKCFMSWAICGSISHGSTYGLSQLAGRFGFKRGVPTCETLIQSVYKFEIFVTGCLGKVTPSEVLQTIGFRDRPEVGLHQGDWEKVTLSEDLQLRASGSLQEPPRAPRAFRSSPELSLSLRELSQSLLEHSLSL